MHDLTARLTILRQDPGDVGYRQVIMSLDEERIGELLFRQSMTREIPPGRHKLRAYNTLVWKTVEFDAKPGEHVRFSTVNYAARGFVTLMLWLGVGPLFVRLDRLSDDASQ